MSPEATSNTNAVLDSKSCNYTACLTSRLTHDLQERLAAYLVLPNGQPLLAKAKSSVDYDPTHTHRFRLRSQRLVIAHPGASR